VLSLEDVEFPRWLWQRMEVEQPEALLAAAHLTSQTRQGHVGTRIPLGDSPVSLFGHEKELNVSAGQRKQLDRWIEQMEEALGQSSVVGTAENTSRPLILDRGYLYYQRFWRYEVELAEQLMRLASETMDGFAGKAVDEWMGTLLPGEDEGIHWQRLTLWMALRRRLLVLTGGPGTGKTYTLIRLVALQLLARTDDAPGVKGWNVALAAPTGKAAARINESIAGSVEELREELPEEVVNQLPVEAQTIHRLLGTRRHRPEFRHNKEHPLPHDVVVVDEASMVDIALMTKLVEALKPGAQLVLIGDKDQLASVEAGSVLGDICQPTRDEAGQKNRTVNTFSKQFYEELKASKLVDVGEEVVREDGSPLMDCIVELTYSRRFKDAPDIGRLAELVNNNRAKEAIEHLDSSEQVRRELPRYLREIRERCQQWSYTSQTFTADQAEALFRSWNQFQVLAAHRRGKRSATAVNQLLESWMRGKGRGLAGGDGSNWYAGRPIMVTENNYELGLFNGDIGLTVRDDSKNGALRVLFEKRGIAGYRSVAPAQLTRHEPAWALTVHKSQGSEFDDVLLVMPEQLSPVLTRELIYTALTRAKHTFNVWSEPDLLKKAIEQRIRRTSNLSSRLEAGSWKAGSDLQ